MSTIAKNSDRLWLHKTCNFTGGAEKKSDAGLEGKIVLNKKVASNNFLELGTLKLQEYKVNGSEAINVYIDLDAYEESIPRKNLLLSLKYLFNILSKSIVSSRSCVLADLIEETSTLVKSNQGNSSSEKFEHIHWDLFSKIAIEASFDALALNTECQINATIEFNEESLVSLLLS